MKKLSLASLSLSLVSLCSVAQNEADALRYSQTTFNGTARYDAMGGAFGALGGDFSTLSSNPAGIGLYRKSEITISPSLYSQSTSSAYNGTTSNDNNQSINLGNIGIVLTHNREREGEENREGWKTFSFGFGYNRQADFNSRVTTDGFNSSSSLLNTFVNSANGLSPSQLDPFSSQLGYNAYLINPIRSTNNYSSAISNGANIEQRQTLVTSGSMGETVFTFGGNYNNRLYLGATLGLASIRYNSSSVYQEIDPQDSLSYTYNNSVSTRGNGVDVKFGAIYRVTDWLRLGGAVNSPTYYSMTDNYNSSIQSNFPSASYNAQSPEGSFDYRLTTPMKLIGSAGFVVADKGLIGIDYEYIDYSTATLSSSPDAFSQVNANIRNEYQATGNLRVGAEWRMDPFSIRAGYALYGNPYKSDVNIDASRTSYSVGVGMRQKRYFIDLAFVYTTYGENYYLYDPSIVNPAKNTTYNSSIVTTLGYRF